MISPGLSFSLEAKLCRNLPILVRVAADGMTRDHRGKTKVLRCSNKVEVLYLWPKY